MSFIGYAILFSSLLVSHLFVTPVSLHAQQNPGNASQLFPQVSAEDNRHLHQGHALTQRYGQDVRTGLAPNLAAGQRVQQTTTAVNPSFGVEALYFHPNAAAHTVDPVKFYNITRAISTMEGLQYTVEFGTERRTLYRLSHAVEGPTSNRRVADPVVQTVPHESVLYAVQEDSGFGRNTYRVTHFHDSGVTHIQMSNLTTIRIGFIPVIRPGNFILHFVLVPTEEGVYFYSNGAMQVGGIMSGFDARAQEGLRVRIEALYHWFVGELATLTGPIN